MTDLEKLRVEISVCDFDEKSKRTMLKCTRIAENNRKEKVALSNLASECEKQRLRANAVLDSAKRLREKAISLAFASFTALILSSLILVIILTL